MKCKNGNHKCDHCGKFTAKQALTLYTQRTKHNTYHYDLCFECLRLYRRA